MSTLNSNFSAGKLDKFYKWLTVHIFYLLPVRVATLFVELSIGFLVLGIRESKTTEIVNTAKLNQLLHANYDKEFLTLPKTTVSWFWTDDYIDSYVDLRTGRCTIREALADSDVLLRNIGTITNELIDNLPLLIKKKLRVTDDTSRLELKLKLATFITSELRYA